MSKEHERDLEERTWVKKLRQKEALKNQNGSESCWIKKGKAAEDKNRVLMDEAKGFIAKIEALQKQLHDAEERFHEAQDPQGPLPKDTPCTTSEPLQID